jgi:hypothetical protein
MSIVFRRCPLLLAAFAVFGAACSDESPTGPDTSDLEVLIVRGNEQFGEPGSLLPLPLEVRVQALSDSRGMEGVKVRWEILEGEGASLDQATSLTDPGGLTSVRLTLGMELGRYRVRASVQGMLSGPADFQAQAVLTPELTLVPDYPVRAGDTIRLEGRNLSPNPNENVVTFSGVRGRVVSVSTAELRVEVPPCLPERAVGLRLHIGTLATPPSTLFVLEGDQYLSLAVGEDRIMDASDGLACFRLPSATGARYLVVPHTTGMVGGAVYDFDLVGLTQEDGPQTAPAHTLRIPPPSLQHEGKARPEPVDLQWDWNAKLRTIEAELVKEGGPERTGGRTSPSPADRSLPERAPQIGDRREFNVLNADEGFDKVSARIQLITDHALVYLDEEAPSDGFTSSDLALMAAEFESPIYPTVTGAFGSESDLDGNGRVVILLTPAVNRLTPEESDSYVGGFFFGLDLLADRTGSNEGEIFYAVVPDPTGIHGPALARSALLYTLPSILAHEFEHMVHFNQRILVSGAETQDALWLSEALAQMAEDLVGDAYQAMGDPAQAQQYHMGNWSRARRFLLDPSHVSVLATLPPGTLEERGAGWLLLKYLYGHDEPATLLGRLTASTRTGVWNVTEAVGRPWEELMGDWAGALYLDGLQVPVRAGLRFVGLNLRYALSLFDGEFPLKPPVMGTSAFLLSASLWSSAPDYYIITSPKAGGLALNLSGLEGRPPEPAAGLRILVVRLN